MPAPLLTSGRVPHTPSHRAGPLVHTHAMWSRVKAISTFHERVGDFVPVVFAGGWVCLSIQSIWDTSPPVPSLGLCKDQTDPPRVGTVSVRCQGGGRSMLPGNW